MTIYRLRLERLLAAVGRAVLAVPLTIILAALTHAFEGLGCDPTPEEDPMREATQWEAGWEAHADRPAPTPAWDAADSQAAIDDWNALVADIATAKRPRNLCPRAAQPR